MRRLNQCWQEDTKRETNCGLYYLDFYGLIHKSTIADAKKIKLIASGFVLKTKTDDNTIPRSNLQGPGID